MEELEEFKWDVKRPSEGTETDLVCEENRSIDFLDIINSKGGHERRHYQKTCYVGSFSHSNSAIGKASKVNMIRGMIKRVKKISTKKYLGEDLARLKRQFSECGYRNEFLRRFFLGKR